MTEFRTVQPLTGAAPEHPVEGWILATPEGLAVGWRVAMPAGVPRSRQTVQRDFEAQVDRVNLMVDFDGDARTGYNFTISSTGGISDAVITNENNFHDDWDGNWRHAVSEDEHGWSAEARGRAYPRTLRHRRAPAPVGGAPGEGRLRRVPA